MAGKKRNNDWNSGRTSRGVFAIAMKKLPLKKLEELINSSGIILPPFSLSAKMEADSRFQLLAVSLKWRGCQYLAVTIMALLADYPLRFHLLDNTSRAVVANAELTLHAGNRSFALFCHEVNSLIE